MVSEGATADKIAAWRYLATSYGIAILLFAGAVWLCWEWHPAMRLLLLGYLAIGVVVFPLARLPGELLVASTALWSPIHLTGLLAIVPAGLVYAVTLSVWPVFAPIGGVVWLARRKVTAQAAGPKAKGPGNRGLL